VQRRRTVANQPLCGHPDERRLLPDLKGLERFVSMHAATYNTFNLQRHLITRRTLRTFRAKAMGDWNAAAA
jgi:putative transposase